MSDAAASPVPEDPGTWSEDEWELEMIRGNARERTADPVVWVDARCVGCCEVFVCTVPATRDWTDTQPSFARYCPVCGVLAPHNAVATLTGLNRRIDRARVQRGGGGGQ